MGVDWVLAGSVVLTGLVLVFVILIVLIMVVELTSRIVNSAEKGSGAAPAKAESAAVVVQNTAALQAPRVQAGIEEETVAAIMAAVSCMADSVSGTKYAVKNISRATSGRPVWGFAGMQQNTRPF